MIQEMRNWKSEQDRPTVEELLNNTLMEYEYGCDDPTESEELLQFPSDENQQGDRRRHDRRDPGPWVQSDEEGESEYCRCGHPREEDKKLRREGAWD